MKRDAEPTSRKIAWLSGCFGASGLRWAELGFDQKAAIESALEGILE